mgnify:CR=1 FL=1
MFEELPLVYLVAVFRCAIFHSGGSGRFGGCGSGRTRRKELTGEVGIAC